MITNYDSFLETIKQDLCVIIAKTKTCAVCKPMSDKLFLFMKNYPSIPTYELYLEDVELFQGQQLVFTVPTVIVYSDSKEILRESRFIGFEKLTRLFSIYLGEGEE